MLRWKNNLALKKIYVMSYVNVANSEPATIHLSFFSLDHFSINWDFTLISHNSDVHFCKYIVDQKLVREPD